MTLPYKGASVPGPIGVVPGTTGGRIPGPLRFEHINLAKSAATKAKPKPPFEMPPPTHGKTKLSARAVDWSLSSSSPLTEDVLQGELANCPIASILAALAHTGSGKGRINRMVKEYTGASVKTTFSPEIVADLTKRLEDDLDDPAPLTEIASQRYFSVNIGKEVLVSDVFYIRFGTESNVDMIYMGSPNEALWPCVIEKAFAVKFGTYDEVDNEQKHTVNEFWAALVGNTPQVFKVDDKTDLNKIKDWARAAAHIPTIGASRDDAKAVLSDHGFAILGLLGSDIQLYDPHGSKPPISVTDFRANFKAIYFGNP